MRNTRLIPALLIAALAFAGVAAAVSVSGTLNGSANVDDHAVSGGGAADADENGASVSGGVDSEHADASGSADVTLPDAPQTDGLPETPDVGDTPELPETASLPEVGETPELPTCADHVTGMVPS